MFRFTNIASPVNDIAFPTTYTMFPVTHTVFPAYTLFPLMEADPDSVIPFEEMKMIHEVERKLYSMLTNDLLRDPFECMMVMALWIWLERSQLTHIIEDILSLHPFLIDEIADEAKFCLIYLKNPNSLNFPPQLIELPATQMVLGPDMTLRFFHDNQSQANIGIKEALTEICFRALKDLMQLAKERNDARAFEARQAYMASLVQMNINNFRRFNPMFGRFPVMIRPTERTVFVTFSRGYLAPEWDILNFFKMIYGDRVEFLSMQEAHFYIQSFYGHADAQVCPFCCAFF